jgi:hypothetical protein
MTTPLEQKQHRVSKVYLKQFGYQKDGRWYVSAWEKTKNHTDNFLIDTFTVETNLFDLPFDEVTIKRHFEDMSQKVEDRFPTILNTIKHQQKLIPLHKDWLVHYTANFICRSKPPREYFQFLLDHETGSQLFLEEITMFKPEELEEWKKTLPLIPSEHRLNLAIGTIMNYLVTVLRSFSFAILTGDPSKGWFTSDNPIYIDPQEEDKPKDEYLYIVPINSEIYFPLSPDYCLFAFHKNADKKTNPLRQLATDKLHRVGDEIHDKICKLIAGNGHQYFILNTETEKTFLDS